MTATLAIDFEDDTRLEIELEKAIALNVSAERRQSLEFRQTTDGKWVMAFTTPLFAGKKFRNITVRKSP